MKNLAPMKNKKSASKVKTLSKKHVKSLSKKEQNFIREQKRIMCVEEV